ncbi:MAG: hypothetical protein GY780_01035 [bacterium]|nr:hypothetical protein [bacterium]
MMSYYYKSRKLISCFLLVSMIFFLFTGCSENPVTGPVNQHDSGQVLEWSPNKTISSNEMYDFQEQLWEGLFTSSYGPHKGYAMESSIGDAGIYSGQSTDREGFQINIIFSRTTTPEEFASYANDPDTKDFIQKNEASLDMVMGEITTSSGTEKIIGIINSGVQNDSFWSQMIPVEIVPDALYAEILESSQAAKSDDCRDDCQDENGISGPLTIPQVDCPDGTRLNTRCAQGKLDGFKRDYNDLTTDFCNAKCSAMEEYLADAEESFEDFLLCSAAAAATGWFTFGIGGLLAYLICVGLHTTHLLAAKNAFNTKMRNANNTYSRKKATLMDKLNSSLEGCCEEIPQKIDPQHH